MEMFFPEKQDLTFHANCPMERFDISCKFSPVETLCMKCWILFSGKNKKNIINLLSVELAKSVVKVKLTML